MYHFLDTNKKENRMTFVLTKTYCDIDKNNGCMFKCVNGKSNWFPP